MTAALFRIARVTILLWGTWLLLPPPAVRGHAPEALAIGQVAPEIEGPDIDGVKFKLSDYRGKVVVLDFWGDW